MCLLLLGALLMCLVNCISQGDSWCAVMWSSFLFEKYLDRKTLSQLFLPRPASWALVCVFWILPFIKQRGTHHLLLLILVAEVGQDKYYRLDDSKVLAWLCCKVKENAGYCSCFLSNFAHKCNKMKLIWATNLYCMRWGHADKYVQFIRELLVVLKAVPCPVDDQANEGLMHTNLKKYTCWSQILLEPSLTTWKEDSTYVIFLLVPSVDGHCAGSCGLIVFWVVFCRSNVHLRLYFPLQTNTSLDSVKRTSVSIQFYWSCEKYACTWLWNMNLLQGIFHWDSCRHGCLSNITSLVTQYVG